MMTSAKDQMMIWCGNARNHVWDRCDSLGNVIRKGRLRETLATHWRRLSDGMRLMHSHIRNRMTWFHEGGDGSQPLREPEPTRYHRQDHFSLDHQCLEEIAEPLDYFGKCRKESIGLPNELLLPAWSTPDEGGGGGGGGGGEGKGRGTLLRPSGGGFSLPEHFSARELEQYLVYSIHSPDLDRQLQSVPREDVSRSKTIAAMPCNIKKNRYKNNVPYDDTRVVLDGEAESDYINASYIEGITGPRDYIATQGPKEANERTIDEFWRMVWQNKSNVIVMLGNLVEGGRGKVSQYWPQNCGEKEIYGEVKVEKKSEREDVNWLRRHLIIKRGPHSRELVQYQYLLWPDHGVPGSPYGAARLVKDMCRWRWTGPPVIHCSAGLGRTGTILLVLRLLNDLQKNGRFHSLNTLRSMRKCRANLLDNEDQYRFAQRLLLEIFFGRTTRLPLEKMSSKSAVFRHQLPDQYKELKSAPCSLTYQWAESHDPSLNRDSSVLPADGRQILMSVKDLSKGYVNAVRVRNSSLQDAFIVTEHPMRATISRCWALAYMAQASAWVFLHDPESLPSVLPPNDFAELGDITVQVNARTDMEFFTDCSITLSQREDHVMRVIQLKNWRPASDLPNPLQSLVFLAKHLQEICRSSPRRIIMISCSDGYSGSGLFVALMRVLCELQLTQSVDVYRTVQSILFDRPQFITAQRQYFYLHDAAIVYFKMQKAEERKGSEEVKQRKRIQPGDFGQKVQKECQPRQVERKQGLTTESVEHIKAGNVVRKTARMAIDEESQTQIVGQEGGKEYGAVKRDGDQGLRYRERQEIIRNDGTNIQDTRSPHFNQIKQGGTKTREVKDHRYENIWAGR